MNFRDGSLQMTKNIYTMFAVVRVAESEVMGLQMDTLEKIYTVSPLISLRNQGRCCCNRKLSFGHADIALDTTNRL